MSNRKFIIENEIETSFHYRLISIASSKFENDWASHPHNHPFTEIFFIKGGSGYMQVENESVPLSPNSVIVIGAQVVHTEYSTPGDPLDYYVLGVEDLHLNTETEAEYLYVPASSNSLYIRHCCENILREMHDKHDGYAEICQHFLAILILYLSQKESLSSEPLEEPSSSRQFHRIKRFIESNYQSKITLDTLARNCSFSKYYLSHRFCELYGVSPIAYLNDVRLAAARDLLLSTNHSMEEIANNTGFSSASYFSQSFQKKYHISPQYFRKQHQSGD